MSSSEEPIREIVVVEEPIQKSLAVTKEAAEDLGQEMDPRRLQRLVSNRKSSKKYRNKKAEYTTELEAKLRALQAEMAVTSSSINNCERAKLFLTAANTYLKQKIADSARQLLKKKDEFELLKKEREMVINNAIGWGNRKKLDN